MEILMSEETDLIAKWLTILSPIVQGIFWYVIKHRRRKKKKRKKHRRKRR